MSAVTTDWTEEEVFKRFRAVLADVLVLDEGEIERSSKLVDDLDADSIGFLELTWRLRQDFGVAVPEVKVDEETLSMALLDGLARIGAEAGGVTLFEFMKAAAASGRGSTFGERAVATLRGLIGRDDFPDRLQAVVDRARSDDAARAPLVALLHELRTHGELGTAFDDVLATHDGLADEVRQLQTSTPADAALHAEEALSLWAQLLSGNEDGRKLFELRVEDLGALLGAGVPDGLGPEAPLSALILRDLFRFVTVDAYVQYILFLHGSASAHDGA